MKHRTIISFLLSFLILFSMFCVIPPASADYPIEQRPIEEGSESSSIEITGSHYVAVGKKITLKASKSVTWESSDPKRAEINKKGEVKGLKSGSVKIIARLKDGSYKTWKLTVKAKAVTSVSIEAPATEFDLNVTREVRLEAKAAPAKAAQSFSWKSSDTSIATVTSSGLVKAKKTGKVKITAIATDGSGKKASVKLTFTEGSGEDPTPGPSSSAVYRALLIGERDFMFSDGPDYCYRNEGDVKMMAKMLGQVYGPGGSKYQVTKKINASYHQIKSLIQSTFSGTKDTDVSLFFIATHGDSDGDGDLILSGNSSVSSLPFSTLAAWLGTYVKGEVIVIIESCGAGSAIYAGRDEENSTKAADTDNSGKIASAAVRAFSAADPGILESNSTGDLRKPKYYVLAAARHRELSWGNADYNYFTKWLVDGVGKTGKSEADTNKNGLVTLTELFNYIHKKGDSFPFRDGGKTYHQHVQRYPVGSQYNLFLLK